MTNDIAALNYAIDSRSAKEAAANLDSMATSAVKAEKTQQELSRSVENMNRRISELVRIQETHNRSINDITAAILKQNQALSQQNTQINEAKTVWKSFTDTVSSFFLVFQQNPLGRITDDMRALALQVRNLALELGTTPDKVTSFGKAVKDLNLSDSTGNAMLGRMATAIGDPSRNGAGAGLRNSIGQLGIGTQGKDELSLFREINQELNKLADGYQKNLMIQRIYGSASAEVQQAILVNAKELSEEEKKLEQMRAEYHRRDMERSGQKIEKEKQKKEVQEAMAKQLTADMSEMRIRMADQQVAGAREDITSFGEGMSFWDKLNPFSEKYQQRYAMQKKADRAAVGSRLEKLGIADWFGGAESFGLDYNAKPDERAKPNNISYLEHIQELYRTARTSEENYLSWSAQKERDHWEEMVKLVKDSGKEEVEAIEFAQGKIREARLKGLQESKSIYEMDQSFRRAEMGSDIYARADLESETLGTMSGDRRNQYSDIERRRQSGVVGLTNRAARRSKLTFDMNQSQAEVGNFSAAKSITDQIWDYEYEKGKKTTDELFEYRKQNANDLANLEREVVERKYQILEEAAVSEKQLLEVRANKENEILQITMKLLGVWQSIGIARDNIDRQSNERMQQMVISGNASESAASAGAGARRAGVLLSYGAITGNQDRAARQGVVSTRLNSALEQASFLRNKEGTDIQRRENALQADIIERQARLEAGIESGDIANEPETMRRRAMFGIEQRDRILSNTAGFNRSAAGIRDFEREQEGIREEWRRQGNPEMAGGIIAGNRSLRFREAASEMSGGNGDLQRQIGLQSRLANAIRQGPGAENKTLIENEKERARLLLDHLATTEDEKKEVNKLVDEYGNLLQKQNELNETARAGKELRALDKEIELLEYEVTLLGKSADERRRLISLKQAEMSLRDRTDLSPEDRQRILGKEEEAGRLGQRNEIARREAAEFEGIWRGGIRSVEYTFTNSLRDVMRTGRTDWKSMVQSFENTIMDMVAQLASKNLMKMIFGDAAFGGGGSSDSGFGGLLGLGIQAGMAFFGGGAGAGLAAAGAAQSGAAMANISTGVGAVPYARGGAWSNGVRYLETGGLVDRPTYFADQGGARMNVMGEAGTEAVMPLARGPDGNLGVRMHGASGGSSMYFNIDARGAEPGMENRVRQAVKEAVYLSKLEFAKEINMGGQYAKLTGRRK